MTMHNIYGGLTLAPEGDLEGYGDAATRKKRRAKRRTRRKSRRTMRRSRRSVRRSVRQETKGLPAKERRQARRAARKATRKMGRIQRKQLRASRGLKGTKVPQARQARMRAKIRAAAGLHTPKPPTFRPSRKPAGDMSCPIPGQKKVIAGRTYVCHNGKYMRPRDVAKLARLRRRMQSARTQSEASAYNEEAMALAAEAQQPFEQEFAPEPQYAPGQEMVDTSAYWDGSSGGGGGGGGYSPAEAAYAEDDEFLDDEEGMATSTKLLIGGAVVLAAGAGIYYYRSKKAEEAEGLEGPEAIGVTN